MYSPNTLYLLCNVTLALRLLAYSLCTDISMIWWIYSVQILHGINVGIGFSVQSVYLNQIGDFYTNKKEGVNVKSTVQSLKGIIALVSVFSGSCLWLPLYQRVNAQMVYVLGSLSLIPSIVLLSYFRGADRKLFNVHSSSCSNHVI